MIGILTTFIMLGMGVYIYLEVRGLPQLRYQYDTICDRYYANCRVHITIDKKLVQPVYLFIEIDPISQTIFPLKDSFSITQLEGNLQPGANETDEDLLSTDCKFALLNQDMSDVIDIEAAGLNPMQVAYPCGLMTKYFPSDDFYKIEMIQNAEGVAQNHSYAIESSGLIPDSWKSNVQYKNTAGKDNWMDVESERFMIWMKRSSMYAPSKLWGVINNDLEPGEYYVHIKISYDVSTFGGKKFFVINGNTTNFSTSNMFIYIFPTLLVLPLTFFNILLCITMKKYNSSNDKKAKAKKDEEPEKKKK
jgi:hypothetical protein